MTKIWMLWSHADDYHGGSSVISLHWTEDAAHEAKLLEEAKPGCEKCGDRPHIQVTSMTVCGSQPQTAATRWSRKR